MCESSVNVMGPDESWFRLVSFPTFGWGVLWAGLHGWFSGWKWWRGVSMTVMWGGCLKYIRFIKQHWSGVHIACVLLERHISPYWADGLERNCFWADSSLFSPNGLERKSCHDIWASNGLYFICRLCCWGPGPCTNVHIPIFQLLYQLST